MTEARGEGARRLWLVGVIAVVVALGSWRTLRSHAEDGEAPPVRLATGRPLLLEFGMGVCQQCRRMAPVMERVRRDLGDLVEVHVLDVRRERAERLARHFGLRVIPLVILTDGRGHEVWRQEGFIDREDLERQVGEHLRARRASREENR